MEAVSALPQSLIGREASSGGHEWGRRFQEMGHTVRAMAPKFVAPYRKSGKSDGNDAEAARHEPRRQPNANRSTANLRRADVKL